MKCLFRLICALFVLTAWEGRAGAYSSVTVSIEDPVYRRIDKLTAHGLIKTQMIGQRPYARSEVARLVAEAMKNYPEFADRFRQDRNQAFSESAKRLKDKVYVDKILKRLSADYRDELIQLGVAEGRVPRVQGQVIDELRWDFAYLDQERMLSPPDNGFGGLTAQTLPLVENRGGRRYIGGANIGIETSHWLRLGKHFSLQAEPRFQVQVAKGDEPEENQAFIQKLSGRFTWRKLDLQMGRDSVNWGPSSEGGLSFSNNARPLDFIKLSSVNPFHYPSWFKKLGVTQWSLVVANLGPEQRFKDSWLVTYKNSTRVSPFLEVGFSQSLLMGGEGAPDLGFGGSLGEFFGAGGHSQSSSNRNIDIEVIGSIPPWGGLQLYAELNFEDFDRDLDVLFRDDLSWIAGIYLPRASRSGTLDFRLEYRRLSARYGRHPIFSGGMVENGLSIGDPLGADAQSIQALARYDLSPRDLVVFGLRYARRNGDLYGVDFDSNGVTGRSTLVDLPAESRIKTWISLRHDFDSHLSARLGFGWEGVRNSNFQSGEDASQWLAEAGFTYRFGSELGLGRQH